MRASVQESHNQGLTETSWASEHFSWRRGGSLGGGILSASSVNQLLAALEARRRKTVGGPGGPRHSAAMTCACGLWRSHGHLLSADAPYLRWRVGIWAEEVVACPGELGLGHFISYPAQLGSQLDLISCAL